MGYTTDFSGEWNVTPHLRMEHKEYLRAFAGTRRMRRDAEKAELLPDPIRIAAGLPIGYEGAYYVGGDGYRGQDRDDSVIDGNDPPGSVSLPVDDFSDIPVRLNREKEINNLGATLGLAQPGLWCQWVPSHDGSFIEWDGGEKFYAYLPWIEYLIDHFIGPWGYKLNGTVEWSGEESSDIGRIRIDNNVVKILHPSWR
jgi:hypothetical protein